MLQMDMGMMGMCIVHPSDRGASPVDRDFSIMLSERAIKPGTRKADTTEMTDFNVLTMNSRAFPGAAPLVAKRGDRRRANPGFGTVAGNDRGRSRRKHARRRVVADASGEWAFHCHMTHHVMNQMGHRLPNMLGVRTGHLGRRMQRLLPGCMTMGHDGMADMASMFMPVPRNSIPMVGGAGPFGTMIDMGGMFTIIKVRDELASYDDPGWCVHPTGTIATDATKDDLRADGIDV